MAKAQAFELREGGEEMSGEPVVRRRPPLELRPDRASEVIDRVVAAPEDPVVRGEAVVVELVARVADALTPPPSHGRELRGTEWFCHEDVVIDRDHLPAQAAQKWPERVRTKCHSLRRGRPVWGADPDSRPSRRDRGDG